MRVDRITIYMEDGNTDNFDNTFSLCRMSLKDKLQTWYYLLFMSDDPIRKVIFVSKEKHPNALKQLGVAYHATFLISVCK